MFLVMHICFENWLNSFNVTLNMNVSLNTGFKVLLCTLVSTFFFFSCWKYTLTYGSEKPDMSIALSSEADTMPTVSWNRTNDVTLCHLGNSYHVSVWHLPYVCMTPVMCMYDTRHVYVWHLPCVCIWHLPCVCMTPVMCLYGTCHVYVWHLPCVCIWHLPCVCIYDTCHVNVWHLFCVWHILFEMIWQQPIMSMWHSQLNMWCDEAIIKICQHRKNCKTSSPLL